jgi:methionyl-tRNA formyltransferase
VVVAYGLLLPRAVLDAPRLGCFNGHASLLPRWRGAAPIHRAIIAGDDETGVMVMKMEEGLDTGPVAMTAKLPIGPDMTTGELHDLLSERGAGLMVQAMSELERGWLVLTPQSDVGVTYAKKIDKAETRVDWTLGADRVHNLIRGLSPFPGAWCEFLTGQRPERLKLLRSSRAEGKGEPGTLLDGRLTVACGDGAVRLREVQRAGGKAVDAEEFLRGTRLSIGDRLT